MKSSVNSPWNSLESYKEHVYHVSRISFQLNFPRPEFVREKRTISFEFLIHFFYCSIIAPISFVNIHTHLFEVYSHSHFHFNQISILKRKSMSCTIRLKIDIWIRILQIVHSSTPSYIIRVKSFVWMSHPMGTNSQNESLHIH